MRMAVGISRSGFSLLELAVVLVVIGMAATIALPMFSDVLTRREADADAWQAAAAIAHTRSLSRAMSKPHEIRFTSGDDVGLGHTIVPMPTGGNVLMTKPFIQAGDPAPSFRFDIFGMPVWGGFVTAKAGGYSRMLTVNAETGNVEIE
ncbi:MAG: prepilin-type N-terminal cleavage/methylation domain-containing protein [Planctomycetota bacterium]